MQKRQGAAAVQDEDNQLGKQVVWLGITTNGLGDGSNGLGACSNGLGA